MKRTVMTLGRLNPPTLGHDVLIQMVLDQARKLDAEPYLFIVEGGLTSKDKNKNPLTGAQRMDIIRRLYPELKIEIVFDAFQAAEVLDVQNKEPTVWIAGSDRAPNYRKLLVAAGANGRVIEVDREAGEADGVTATAARQAARDGEWETFKSLMPRRASNALLHEIMNMIRESSTDDCTSPIRLRK